MARDPGTLACSNLGQRVISEQDSEQDKLNKTLADLRLRPDGLRRDAVARHLLGDGHQVLRHGAAHLPGGLGGLARALPVEAQFRAVPLHPGEPVPVRAVHHAVDHRQLRELLGRDAVGAARAGRRDDLPGPARVDAVVLRLHRDDGDLGLLRLLPRRRRAAGRHHADGRGVLRRSTSPRCRRSSIS